MQLVTHSVEPVDGRMLAGFRSLPAHLPNCDSVAGHRVLSPYIRFTVLVQINLERSVGVNRPYSAKGVGPRADKSSWAGCGGGCTSADEHGQSTRENNSKRVL
jgi:hypothetical protein